MYKSFIFALAPCFIFALPPQTHEKISWPPIKQSCHSIDMHIWGRISPKLFTVSSSPKYFTVPLISPPLIVNSLSKRNYNAFNSVRDQKTLLGGGEWRLQFMPAKFWYPSLWGLAESGYPPPTYMYINFLITVFYSLIWAVSLFLYLVFGKIWTPH